MSNDLKLYEVNSKLVGMTYDIPDEVLFHIKNTLLSLVSCVKMLNENLQILITWISTRGKWYVKPLN